MKQIIKSNYPLNKKNLFTVENLTNASIVIRGGGEKIVIDPWFKDGIYDGTWHNFPRLNDEKKLDALNDVDVCMYTHLHKDHFCIDTAKKYFKPSTNFLIPKVFGWQVIQGLLNKNGFPLTHVLECCKDIYETKNFQIMTVPPLNVSGLEAQNEVAMAIDSGFSLVHKGNKVKCVFLADDNMYSEVRVKENIEIIKNPDLIAFAYSGFASDYPYNFNFSDDEMIRICNDLEDKRFKKQLNSLRLLNPKCIMPYSSEFVATGKHSKKWLEILCKIWTSNKNFVANKYASELEVEGIALYPDDYVIFDENGNKTNCIKPFSDVGEYSLKALLSYADDYLKNIKPLVKKTDISDELIQNINKKLKLASINYKNAIIKHNLKPLQSLIICINENHLFAIDCEGNVVENYKQEDKKPYLKLNVEHDFLERLVDGNLHWNDGCLSMKLSWEREPNIFCSDTVNAINYLKL